ENRAQRARAVDVLVRNRIREPALHGRLRARPLFAAVARRIGPADLRRRRLGSAHDASGTGAALFDRIGGEREAAALLDAVEQLVHFLIAERAVFVVVAVRGAV